MSHHTDLAETGKDGTTTGKYLTFELADEGYGIEILKVKEIVGMMSITPVPRLPEYVKGVVNLRGKVIPVIDLRLKFGMNAADYTDRTCIIVVEIMQNTDKTRIGLVVDAVSEVLNVRSENVEPPPSFGSRLQTNYILGMAKFEDSVKILLDIDLILTAETIEKLTNKAHHDQTGGNESDD